MNIELNSKYRITSDKHQLILQEKKYPDPNSKLTKDPNAWKWVDVGYYGKLEHLVSALLEKEIRESEAENLQDLALSIGMTTLIICERLEGKK